jgi:putative NADH-flavin reductase
VSRGEEGHAPRLRIAVLGASGATGRRFVQEAVRHGHEVRALVRRPGVRFPTGVEVVEGDALDEGALERLVQGAQAIVCFLGPARNSPPDVSSRATRLLIGVMRRAGVRRLVVQTGAMIGHARLGSFYRWLAQRKVLREPLAERREQERWVCESGLDWTLIRPPRLTNGAPPGSVQVGAELPIGFLDRATRTDVARVHLSALGGCWNQQGVAVVSRLGASNPGALLRAWVVRVGLAEFLGIATAALVAGLWLSGFGEPTTALMAWGFFVAMVLAGAFEGFLLGALPASILRQVLPSFNGRAFTRNTVITAVAAWMAGMLPSTLMAAQPPAPMPEPSVGMMVGVGVGGGLVGGALIGFAQWLAMRKSVSRAGWWIPATAVGWALGLPLDLLGATLPGEGASLGFILLSGGLFGLLAGAAVAIPTGLAALHLARRAARGEEHEPL